MIRTLFLTAMWIVWGTAALATPSCPPALEQEASAAADRLSDWNAVARYQQRLRGCDDGGMEEASSEGITHLLAQHWDKLSDLAAHVRTTPDLLTFVVRHVNGTADGGDLEKIRALSTAACPIGESQLCQALHEAAVQAQAP